MRLAGRVIVRVMVTLQAALIAPTLHAAESASTAIDMADYVPPVEDPVGLGERLALLDWLHSRGAATAEGIDVAEARRLYWSYRAEHDKPENVPALHHAEVRRRLQESFAIASRPDEPMAALEARLGAAEAEKRRQEDSARAAAEAEAAARAAAAERVPPEPARGHGTAGAEPSPAAPPPHDAKAPTARQLLAKQLKWRYVPVPIAAQRQAGWKPWTDGARAWLENELAKPQAGGGSSGPIAPSLVRPMASLLAFCPDSAGPRAAFTELTASTRSEDKRCLEGYLRAWSLVACEDRRWEDEARVAWLQFVQNPASDYWGFRIASLASYAVGGKALGLTEDQRKADLRKLASSVLSRSEHADAVELRMLGGALTSELFRYPAGNADLESALLEALEKPTGAPWLRELLRGDVEISSAWRARGNGWASTVTDVGWKGFEEHLHAAHIALVKAHELHPDFPEAAADMITVAMGEGAGLEAECEWFYRAIAAQFDYSPAYRALFNAWLPRWGGDHALILAIGDEALQTGWFDTVVPRQFTKALNAIAADVADEPQAMDRLWRNEALWARVRAHYDGYLASGLYGDRPSWFLTDYAATAWRCGHLDIAEQLLDEVGTTVDEDVLRRDHATSAQRIRQEIAAVKAGTPPP